MTTSGMAGVVVGVAVGVAVGVIVAVGVMVTVGVRVTVGVNVGVKVAVGVIVAVGVMVAVTVGVSVLVGVMVLVSVAVGVSVNVVAVAVGVSNSQESSALARITTAISNMPLMNMTTASPAMSFFISHTFFRTRERGCSGFTDFFSAVETASGGRECASSPPTWTITATTQVDDRHGVPP
jgi:hypothetical protein